MKNGKEIGLFLEVFTNFFMNFFIGLLAFFFMLGVIIMIHEAGHFMAARAFGVYCHEFSFGFGPVLWQKQGKNTLFSIRAFPIGGYVSMAGETDYPEESSENDEESDFWLSKVPENEKLNHKPIWQQIIVMIAGVAMNFLLALVLMVGIIQAQGAVSVPAEPIIYEVLDNTPAAKAGLASGDRILKIIASDGTTLEPTTQNELSQFIQFNSGQSTLEILRGDETFTTTIQPELDEESQSYLMGYTTQNQVRKVNFFEAIQEGIKRLKDTVVLVFESFGQLFKGKGVESLSGPVGIYKVTDRVVSYGLLPYLSLCAMISLNIGIFNLLPIPALDGGRVLILLLEGLFKRKVPVKIVEGIILVSFVALFGLMIFSTYNDIVRFFL